MAHPIRTIAALLLVLVVVNHQHGGGKLIVRGSTADNGTVKRVLVNDRRATALTANFLTWETILDTAATLSACAEDEAGIVETLKHVRAVQP